MTSDSTFAHWQKLRTSKATRMIFNGVIKNRRIKINQDSDKMVEREIAHDVITWAKTNARPTCCCRSTIRPDSDFDGI